MVLFKPAKPKEIINSVAFIKRSDNNFNSLELQSPKTKSHCFPFENSAPTPNLNRAYF